jgi:hypothetical protein
VTVEQAETQLRVVVPIEEEVSKPVIPYTSEYTIYYYAIRPKTMRWVGHIDNLITVNNTHIPKWLQGQAIPTTNT